jgi:hypothetical protein
MTQEEITTLQTQQSLFTQALAAMLEGKWQGEGSVEAFLYALNPTFQGALDFNLPVTESDFDVLPKG